MTVSRLRSTSAITSSAEQWPNLSAAYSVGNSSWSTYQFTGDGQDSINGQNYRVHRLELVGGLGSQTSMSSTISFSKAGYIDFILVAAGGSAGAQNTIGGGGGGAGGAIIKYDFYVDAASYPCTIGYAQTPTDLPSFNGQNSVFGSEIAIGGGGGGWAGVGYIGRSGGSGGGNAWSSAPTVLGGLGTAGQGNAGGGNVNTNGTGGGGWASAAPYNMYASGRGSDGGNGFGTRFDGTYRAFCAGGGGGGQSSIGGNGGTVDGVYVGGMGIGSSNTAIPARPTNPGCGGGATYGPVAGPGSGGMLLIRYKI